MNIAPNEKSSPVARDVDVRGFVYALEPVRQRQQWRLDKLMSALGRAQQALRDTEVRIDQVQAMHDEQARSAGLALQQRMDPRTHRHALGFLTHLRDQHTQLEVLRQEQLVEKDRLRKECMALQLRLDGMTQHKEDALTTYADEVRQRNSNEQDRDWLARSAVARSRTIEAAR
ncbi:hypothetical protein JVX96_29830 (plasmid) [Variovorax sp. PDNC026]|uniref:hypothetical protein n=1 Tax=Variovorax sp. PDNC026 TaxID=2811425 RepID=UPI001963061B|nr:hypothetical protein [Variovorax sp. PDNC026]QRY35506.1 hypothetical protein JVX96_29830 [Variovorax sp. PDNC026]